MMRLLPGFVLGLLVIIGIGGCTPEVGTEAWCTMMKEKPKGDWSTNEGIDFTKNCLIR